MRKPSLHSFKSTESSSYEIMYSILDCIDAINEQNSRLDHGSINKEVLLKEIFDNLDIMTNEMESLVKYWIEYRTKHVPPKVE
jgi:hypothetical protein